MGSGSDMGKEMMFCSGGGGGTVERKWEMGIRKNEERR
jgi:hypothetical protein